MRFNEDIELAEDVVKQRWVDVLDSIALNKPYALAPWQPIPGETRMAFVAFASYRDSKQRDVALTAAVMAMTYSDAKDLARMFEWARRAEYYDEWCDRQADSARAEMIARTTLDTAAAFAHLPALASSAFQLVESSVNEALKQQADRAKAGKGHGGDGEEVKPISISQAIRIAETTRALLDATTRFLGVKITVDHTLTGRIDHTHSTVSDTDVLNFLSGLTEAGYDTGDQRLEAIEVTSGD